MVRAPAVIPAVALLAGIAVGCRTPALVGWPVLTISGVVWVCALFSLTLRVPRVFVATTTLGFLAVGMALGANAVTGSTAFVEAMRPVLAVVSAGRHNRFGHPSAEVVRRYENVGAEVLQTGKVGAVSVCSDGQRVWVGVQRGTSRPTPF